jgi:hypothetical protein
MRLNGNSPRGDLWCKGVYDASSQTGLAAFHQQILPSHKILGCKVVFMAAAVRPDRFKSLISGCDTSSDADFIHARKTRAPKVAFESCYIRLIKRQHPLEGLIPTLLFLLLKATKKER